MQRAGGRQEWRTPSCTNSKRQKLSLLLDVNFIPQACPFRTRSPWHPISRMRCADRRGLAPPLGLATMLPKGRNSIIHRVRMQALAYLVVLALCSFPLESVLADGLTEIMRGRHDALHAAILTHDNKSISATLSPNYQGIEASAKTKDRNEWLAKIALIPSDMKGPSRKTVVSAIQEGKLVTVRQHSQMTIIKVVDGAAHEINVEASSTDGWIPVGDTFILQRSAANEISVKVDGILVSHKKADDI